MSGLGFASRRRQLTVFAVFTFAYFLSQFFRHANAVISADVARELSLGAAAMGLMTSLFYLAFAAAQLPLGWGLDRFGPRAVTPAVMSAAAVGALLFGGAHSFAALAAGRTLLGLGMSGVLMGSYMALSHWFPARRFATVSGLVVGIGALGGLGAASPLAWFSVAHGWRSVFFVGAALVAVSAAAILLWGGYPKGERLSSAPQERLGLGDVFRELAFWRLAPLNFFIGGGMLAIQSLWAGPFLYDVAGFSPSQTGRLLTLLSVGAILGYVGCGWLADRFGVVRMSVLSSTVFVLTEVGLIVSAAWPVTEVLSALYFFFGLTGAFQILLLVQVRLIFPSALRGRGVTAVNLFCFAGAASLQWIMGVIIGSFGRDAAQHYPPEAYMAAFGCTGVGALLSLLWYVPVARGARAQKSVGGEN
jgi:MFS family permease